MRDALVLHRPDLTGESNKAVQLMVSRILDGWRVLTPKHVSIASTVYGYSKPAEMISDKQMWNLRQAVAVLDSIEGEPNE